jgi:hypothetical protein
VIESFHLYDKIECKCGEISISGGTQKFFASAKDFSNFLRVSDEGKEIPVRMQDVEEKVESTPLSAEEKLEMLAGYMQSIERLPEHLMHSSITHADLYQALAMIYSLFRDMLK